MTERIDLLQGLGTQTVEASSSLDKLSSGTGDGAFDQLYHPSGRSIDSSSEVDGLRQLFNPGKFIRTGSISYPHPIRFSGVYIINERRLWRIRAVLSLTDRLFSAMGI